MGQALPIIMAVGSMAVQQAESDRVARKQDEQMSLSLMNQARKQQTADAKVNEQLQRMEGSTSADERTQRMDQYMQTLRKGKAKAAPAPAVGGETFRADVAQGTQQAQQYGADTAGLMARMDAPTLQRQNEGMEYGRLATDLGLIGRESEGLRYVDELRMRQIRRRPEADLASGFMSAAGSIGGGTRKISPSYAPVGQGGNAVYGTFSPSRMGYA